MRILEFFAVVLTALALVPGGAHLFELPHKFALPQHDYFTVQSIYRGCCRRRRGFGRALRAA